MSRKIIMFALLISLLNASAGQGSNASFYIAVGRSLMFDGTLSGVRLAYETFDNGLKDNNCADCKTNRELKFLHALTGTAMFAIRDDNGSVDSVLELSKRFNVELLGDYWAPYFSPLGLDIQVPLNQHDAYVLPPGSPDANELRSIINTSMVPKIEAIIAELNSISDSPGNRFRIYFTSDETRIFFGPGFGGLQYNIEVDYGEVLILKGILTVVKAHLLGQSAYDLGIDANDKLLEKIHGRNIDVNEDVFNSHPNLLKVLPTPNCPNVNGTALLAQASSDFRTAIQYYLDAVNYIASEEDDQNDDFLYIDPNHRDVCDAINARLTTMRDSLASDTVGSYPSNTAKHYNVIDPLSPTTWLLTLNYDMFAVPADETGTFVASDFNSAPSPWKITGTSIEDGVIMLEMDYDVPYEWGQALFSGDISADHNTISNATFEYWGAYNGVISNMSGEFVSAESTYVRLDLNPVFGSTPRYPQPVSPRNLMPKFDRYNSPLPNTMGNNLGPDAILGGIVPDMNQFKWNLLLNSQPAGLVYLHEIYPWQKNRDNGFVDVWYNNNLMLDDPAGDTYDKSQKVPNADIKRLYLAYDNEYLYGAIIPYDYNNSGDSGEAHYDLYFSYTPDSESTLDSILFSFSSNGYGEIYHLYRDYDYLWWEYVGSIETQLGRAGIEFRASWYDIPGYIPGRFISLNSEAYDMDWYSSDGEDNPTHIQIGEVGSISGVVTYNSYSGAPIFVQAFTDPADPENSIVASTMLTAPGQYTLTGIGLGWQGYVRAITPLFGFNPFDWEALEIQDVQPVFLWLEDLEDVDFVLKNPVVLKNGVWTGGELRVGKCQSNWFAIDAVSGGTYILDIERISCDYTAMTLFGRNGYTELAVVHNWDTQHFEGECPATGRYYIKVWDESDEPQGGMYQIRMTNTLTCPTADIADEQGPGAGDCVVNIYDLAALTTYWLDNCTAPDWCGGADFDQSGRVDFRDYSTLISQWLQEGGV